jgi:hypothetical protein
MVDEYSKKFYLPAINCFDKLTAQKNKELKSIIDTRKKVAEYWDKIYVKDFFLKFPNPESIVSGEDVNIEAYIYLANAPKDLFTVEIFYQYGEVDNYETIPLKYIEAYPDQVVKFETKFKLKNSGTQNLNIRIKPSLISDIYKECHYIKWRTK